MDVDGIEKRLGGPWLAGWEGEVDAAALAQTRALLDETAQRLIALAPDPTQEAFQAAFDRAVRALNVLDERHGYFIMTIEREDLAECLWALADLVGLDYDPEDLLAERDW